MGFGSMEKMAYGGSSVKNEKLDSKENSSEGSAKEIYDRLNKELDEIISGRGDIEEINKKMAELEKAHQEVLEEMKRKHDEEIKKIEEDPKGTKEDAERKMFGGKTLEESKKDADDFLKKIQEDALKKMAGSNSESKLRDELEKKKEEEEKAAQEMLKQMEEHAKKVTQEAVEGVRQAGGEMTRVKVCSKCGRENEFNSNFCGSCGNKL